MKADKIIGHPIQEVALNNDLIRDLIRDYRVSAEEKKTNKTMKIYADNKESYFEKELIDIQVVPTGEKVSQLIGHVILLRNITPFKELDVAKTNFIGTVSHEFKTPISSMKMSIQLLENDHIGTLNTEQKELVENIKDDANRLLKITGELLNLTQVESGNIQLSQEPADPKELVRRAVEATKTPAEQKKMTVEATLPENVSQVLADEEKTVWILINLISNAIRYSYEGGTVEVKVSEEGDHVKFTVKDQGCGIPEQYLAKVFDRYFRVPGSQKEGTGLGLAISKEFIEAQGGLLGVESEFGSGSAFYFTLKMTQV